MFYQVRKRVSELQKDNRLQMTGIRCRRPCSHRQDVESLIMRLAGLSGQTDSLSVGRFHSFATNGFCSRSAHPLVSYRNPRSGIARDAAAHAVGGMTALQKRNNILNHDIRSRHGRVNATEDICSGRTVRSIRRNSGRKRWRMGYRNPQCASRVRLQAIETQLPTTLNRPRKSIRGWRRILPARTTTTVPRRWVRVQ